MERQCSGVASPLIKRDTLRSASISKDFREDLIGKPSDYQSVCSAGEHHGLGKSMSRCVDGGARKNVESILIRRRPFRKHLS